MRSTAYNHSVLVKLLSGYQGYVSEFPKLEVNNYRLQEQPEIAIHENRVIPISQSRWYVDRILALNRDRAGVNNQPFDQIRTNAVVYRESSRKRPSLRPY